MGPSRAVYREIALFHLLTRENLKQISLSNVVNRLLFNTGEWQSIDSVSIRPSQKRLPYVYLLSTRSNDYLFVAFSDTNPTCKFIHLQSHLFWMPNWSMPFDGEFVNLTSLGNLLADFEFLSVYWKYDLFQSSIWSNKITLYFNRVRNFIKKNCIHVSKISL